MSVGDRVVWREFQDITKILTAHALQYAMCGSMLRNTARMDISHILCTPESLIVGGSGNNKM